MSSAEPWPRDKRWLPILPLGQSIIPELYHSIHRRLDLPHSMLLAGLPGVSHKQINLSMCQEELEIIRLRIEGRMGSNF